MNMIPSRHMLKAICAWYYYIPDDKSFVVIPQWTPTTMIQESSRVSKVVLPQSLRVLGSLSPFELTLLLNIDLE